MLDMHVNTLSILNLTELFLVGGFNNTLIYHNYNNLMIQIFNKIIYFKYFN